MTTWSTSWSCTARPPAAGSGWPSTRRPGWTPRSSPSSPRPAWTRPRPSASWPRPDLRRAPAPRDAGAGPVLPRSPDAGQFLAVPGLDQPVRDRLWRRQQDLLCGQRESQLLPAVPVRFGDLVVVHPQLEVSRGRRAEPEHQALRHRPGLAAGITDPGDGDRGFLLHLAGHGLLGRFPGLDEARQDGYPALRPAPVPGQQAP